VGLEIRQRDNEGICILALHGGLVIGPTEAKLREFIGKLAAAGTFKVILNFAAVGDLDEDGLGALVLCSAKLRKSRGDLKLLNVERVHMELMVLARLDAAFDFFDNEQDAVNSFFPDRAKLHFDILEFVREHTNPAAQPSTPPEKN